MHQPVMLEEAISSLNLKPGGVVLDATIGGGGHAAMVLKHILPGGRLIGLDADSAALKRSEEALKDYKGAFSLVNENFRDLDRALLKEKIKSLNAALFDIGISSYQVDEGRRGFSMKEDGPLDMRMDRRLEITAYDIINRYKVEDISYIIERYGEERFHNRIARRISEERSNKNIETTGELAEIVRSAIGTRGNKGRIDPATRTFQALRIAVNDELGALEEGLKKAVSWLDLGGRVSVISFHSLEDRIVKNIFKGYSSLGILKVITKKPITASREEALRNPRSRSAKLRVAERI